MTLDYLRLVLQFLSVIILPLGTIVFMRFKALDKSRIQSREEFNDKMHALEIKMTDKISREEAASMITTSNNELRTSIEKLHDVIFSNFQPRS